jgi:hypothetical protein
VGPKAAEGTLNTFTGFVPEVQMNFGELLTFRTMITPVIIQVLYIIGLIGVVLEALAVIAMGFGYGALAGLAALVIGAPLVLIIGFLVVRVYCELLILLFKIYEELKAIRTGAAPADVAAGGMPNIPGFAHPTATVVPAAPTP